MRFAWGRKVSRGLERDAASRRGLNLARSLAPGSLTPFGMTAKTGHALRIGPILITKRNFEYKTGRLKNKAGGLAAPRFVTLEVRGSAEDVARGTHRKSGV